MAIASATGEAGPVPLREDVTRLCSEIQGQKFVLQKLREEQRTIITGKRDATAAEMNLLLSRIKAAEAKIDLAEYKARERGIDPAGCKP